MSTVHINPQYTSISPKGLAPAAPHTVSVDAPDDRWVLEVIEKDDLLTDGKKYYVTCKRVSSAAEYMEEIYKEVKKTGKVDYVECDSVEEVKDVLAAQMAKATMLKGI